MTCSSKNRFAIQTIIICTLVMLSSIAVQANIIATAKLTTITGTITDAASQQPLAGVNIMIKGTARGTSSDNNGKFTLETDAAETLVISLIGFKTKEILVGQRTIVDVLLDVDNATPPDDEVIGTNYFSALRRHAAMNIAKVKGADIAHQPVTSLLHVLIGRVTGVDITPVNGAPGITPQVQIRGQNSLRPDATYPLYVVDGVQVEAQPISTYNSNLFAPGFDPLSAINPADIESIEVLKDAAATSIYGARGANGVIKITTRNAGASPKPGLELSAYTGVGNVSNQMDLLNSRQYLTMRREAIRNSGGTPTLLDWDLLNWDTTRYTNFQKELLGHTARITDVHAAITGGNGLNGIRVHGGYHQEGTIYPGDFGLQRITTGLAFNHTSPDRKFNAMASINYGWIRNRSFSGADPAYLALTLPPVAPSLRDSAGNINFQQAPIGPTFSNNPLAQFLRTDQVRSNTIMASTDLSYQLARGVAMHNRVGMQYFVSNQVTKIPIASYPAEPVPYTGQAIFTDNTRTSLVIEPYLTYEKTFDEHRFNIVIGGTWQSRNAGYKSQRGIGYRYDALMNSISNASDIDYLADVVTQYRYASGYTHIGYSYRQKYFVDLSGRRDGSSRFGTSKKYGNFGAMGAAWIFANRAAVDGNFGLLSFGKLRASYGTTGNDQIADYRGGEYILSPDTYQGVLGLMPSTLDNPNYAWESTRKTEIALELGFFHDRIALDAAWYRNKSNSLLATTMLPGTSGLPGVGLNIGAVIQNTGIELTLHTRNLINGPFRWTTSFNYTNPKNKLADFPGLESSVYSNTYKVGEPLNTQLLYTYKGVDPQTGAYMFLDKNTDGVMNSLDRTLTAHEGRRHYGGLTNTFTYRGFELTLLFQYSKAQVTGFLIHPYPGGMANQPVRVMDRWRREGNITTEPQFNTSSETYNQHALLIQSDRNTAMVSFIRLRIASLAYHLPPKLISRAGMSNAQIFIQGQNLLTLTSFDEALDPETLNNLPPLRIINVGFQLNL